MKKNLFLILSVFIFSILSCTSVADSNKENTKEKTAMELVFILDRSGSMKGLEEDTIGGFNSMLEKQKKESGNIIVTTVLFDDQYEIIHNRLPITEIKPITENDYYVRGMTALLDAMGKTILSLKEITKEKKDKNAKVLFIIITDGLENSSREFSSEQVKKLVETQKKEMKWEFLFLGANIDAIETAGNIGIDSSKAVQYHSDKKGTQTNYRVLNEAISEVNAGVELDAKWKKEIEEDYQNRNK